MPNERPLSPSRPLPRVLFVNINGNGTGHLSRCLAYAHRLRGRATPVFLSMASAMEIIHDMGFEGDYFVSEFWSRSHPTAWNRELAMRMGLMLEATQPAVVVFDGTWPFYGLLDACDAYGGVRRVWSNRSLHKAEIEPPPVEETSFDLVLEPGEIGAEPSVRRQEMPGRKVITRPVTMLRDDELLGRAEARAALGLDPNGRYALFSLGPGNLKDVTALGESLMEEVRARGYTVAWARAPISVRDVALPEDVLPISVYPLVRYMRAFDVFAGAAGYNTCCEVIQSGVASLLVPNTLVADDQARRARLVARHAGAVVSACETAEERSEAVSRLLALAEQSRAQAKERPQSHAAAIPLDGAERAADEIFSLIATTEVPA